MNGEITEARFFEWVTDTDDGPITRIALKVAVKTDDGDLKAENIWAVGSTKDWQVTDEGRNFAPTTGAQEPNKNSNFSFMLAEMAKCQGFDTAALEAAPDITYLEGHDFYWQRVPAPKRVGLNRNLPQGREDTILVPTKLNSKPGATAAPAKKTAAAAAAKPAAAAAAKKPATAAAPAPAAAAPATPAADDAAIADGLKALLNTALNSGGRTGSAPAKDLNGEIVAWMNEKGYPSTKVYALLRNAETLAEMGFTMEGGVIAVASAENPFA
ncbi:MAG: hypothetical protein Q8R28_02180 [Dehalococcoidia bacterium]|nr:hypothetical protein [Dehalococcoidia bacterium]